jgi:hypothetical protein
MIKNNQKCIRYGIEEHFVNILIQKVINISENFRQLKYINQISKKHVSQMMKIVPSKNVIVFQITYIRHQNYSNGLTYVKHNPQNTSTL